MSSTPPTSPVRPGSSGPNGRSPIRRTFRFTPRAWMILLAVVVVFNVLYYASALPNQDNPRVTVPYSTFITQVKADNIKTAKITSTTATGDFAKPYTDVASKKTYKLYTVSLLPVQDTGLVPLLQAHNIQLVADHETTPLWLQALSVLVGALPLVLLFGLLYFGTRAARSQQQNVFGFGQSKAKLYNEERPTTTFADVAGVESAKSELHEVVDFLRDPSKYQRVGARIPKGVLLVGPPGTGKTLLARAVAGEARVPFFSISSSEFVEILVGVGASRVRDLFSKAQAAAPAIVFIDEIDAIGRQRGRGALAGGNDEREQTLNQLLVSMDGFETDTHVIVLAATNRPDVLDPALLRPGRFDREVTVDVPDRAGREAILKVHTKKIPLAASVDLTSVAASTPGMTGADLANLANEAALSAARRGEDRITPTDFSLALDRITLGALGTALINAEERQIVAYHEGGHTLVALLSPHADPVNKVTITPRGRSLGVTQFQPIDDRRNYRRDYLLARMAVGLGGRAAEEVAIGEITSGAQNDLQQVTNMARAMVTQLGMSDEVGLRFLGGDENSPYAGMEARAYGEDLASKADEAIGRLIAEAHQRAIEMIRSHRPALDAIAAALIEHESLDQAQLAAIIAPYLTPVGKDTMVATA